MARIILGRGRLDGQVTFTRISPTRLRYDETGLLQLDESTEMFEATRSYLYEQRYLWGDFAAAAILSGLPITIVFLLAQRYLVSGLSDGGVKG